MELSPKIDCANKWSLPQCPPPPSRPHYEPPESRSELDSIAGPRLLRLPSFSRLSSLRRYQSTQQQQQPRISTFDGTSDHSEISPDDDMGFFVDFGDEPSREERPRPLPCFSLKPRASKPALSIFNSIKSSTANSLTRVASSPLFARQSSSGSKNPKRSSLNRRPSMNFTSRRPSFSLIRSPSFHRCRSFSRVA